MKYTGTIYGKGGKRCGFTAITTVGWDEEPAGSAGKGQDALEKRCIKAHIMGKPADVWSEITYWGDYGWAFQHGEIPITSVTFDKEVRCDS